MDNLSYHREHLKRRLNEALDQVAKAEEVDGEENYKEDIILMVTLIGIDSKGYVEALKKELDTAKDASQ